MKQLMTADTLGIGYHILQLRFGERTLPIFFITLARIGRPEGPHHLVIEVLEADLISLQCIYGSYWLFLLLIA